MILELIEDVITIEPPSYLRSIQSLAAARAVLKTPRTLTLKTFAKSSEVRSTAGLTTETPAFCGIYAVSFLRTYILDQTPYSDETADGSELVVNGLEGFDDLVCIGYIALIR